MLPNAKGALLLWETRREAIELTAIGADPQELRERSVRLVAEAMAEGRGKAQADALRRQRTGGRAMHLAEILAAT